MAAVLCTAPCKCVAECCKGCCKGIEDCCNSCGKCCDSVCGPCSQFFSKFLEKPFAGYCLFTLGVCALPGLASFYAFSGFASSEDDEDCSLRMWHVVQCLIMLSHFFFGMKVDLYTTRRESGERSVIFF